MASIVVVSGAGPRERSLVEHLRVAGHGVTTVERELPLATALRERELPLATALREGSPALVIVDAIECGGAVRRCAEVRAMVGPDVAVMVLIGRHDVADRVAILELGADDCVADPFHVRELLLRVRSVLRRRGADGRAPTPERIGPLTFDRHAHRVWVDGEEVALTVSELRLLLHLYDASPRVVARGALQRALGAVDPGEPSRALDAMVKRRRRKLGAAGPFVETVRSVGYRLASRPTAA